MSASSSEWEVVSKSRKQRNLEKKISAHSEQKRIAAQLPKLEEVLPTQQYRNLFVSSGSSNNNTNNTNSNINKSHSPAKSTTSVAPTSSSKAKAPREMKQPAKTLEQALKQISPDEFAAQLAQAKISCPGSELRWLSHIASYLNGVLAFDCDPIFSGRSVQYPSNLASPALKQSILEFLRSVGETNLEYFFYTLLDSMATELNSGQKVVGYKFVLQLIGQNWPGICSHNMAKTALLRNSYQNRCHICLSILWAIGQGGHRSLTEGVKVWQNLMLPNLELKSYSKFVVEHVERVLNAASARQGEALQISQQEFFACFNALNERYIHFPKELQQSLKRSAKQLLLLYLASPVKHADVFMTLLPKIHSKKHLTEIEGCISCLLSSGATDCFNAWHVNYGKHIISSTFLLQAIVNNWTASSEQLVKSQAYQQFLEDLELFELYPSLQSSKRKEFYADDLESILKNVQEKNSAQQKKNRQNDASQKKKCGCCKWVLGSIFIVALIAGALCYDTEVNGKGVFENSATGKVLKNAGVLPQVQRVWYVAMGAGARGYKWAEQHVPPYAEPVIKTSVDVWKVARNACCNAFTNGLNYWRSKWPAIAKFIDQYVPEFSHKLEAFAAGAKDLAVNSYDKSATLIKEKVLVGRFSPENLNQALNLTRNAALEYYNQFHKKVDAYAKLK